MQSKQKLNMIHSNSIFSMNSPYYIHKSVLSCTFGLHRHDFFEIDLIINGEGYSYINGEGYFLKKGDFVILSPTDHHNYILQDSAPLEFVNIAFAAGQFSPQVISGIPSDVKVIHLSKKDYKCVKGICDALVEKHDNNPMGCTSLMRATIEWLLIFLSFNFEKNDKNNAGDGDFSKVIEYISNNFSHENISRDEVAAIVHMSPTHFSKKFHKIMGVTFQEYLQNTRLNYANGLLKMTSMTVSEISALSGFSSDSYFSKIYKKRFGTSPGAAQKNNKRNH